MTVASVVSLRPAGPDDAEALYRIYASTREAELAALPWEEAAKQAFVRLQFTAQDRHYRSAHPQASFDVIVAGDEVLGRLYVDRAPGALVIVDVALAPEHRGRGIGTALLCAVLSEADSAGKPVRLHVQRGNRARRLYERLGFELVAGDDVYVALQRAPDGRPTS